MFDSVSHKFIDEALREVDVQIKLRAVFRAVYAVTSAYAASPGFNGSKKSLRHSK